jgi:hypothetical protein
VISVIFWNVLSTSRRSDRADWSPGVAEKLRKSHYLSRVVGAVVGARLTCNALAVGK